MYNQSIDKDVEIHNNVIIGSNVKISKGVIIYPNVEIKENSFIGPYCIIGEPCFDYYSNYDEHEFKKTVIGLNSIIRSHSIIYEDVIIGDHFQSGHRVTIRENSIIGNNVSIGTSSDLQGKLKIGNHVRLHSNVHIAQLTIIEDYVWIYPSVVFTNDPFPPMGELLGSTVKEYAQIATGSVIMPGIDIGKNSLIGAQTLVKNNVMPEQVVSGCPGKNICSIRQIINKKGKRVYPWKEYLKDYRGYPWQKK